MTKRNGRSTSGGRARGRTAKGSARNQPRAYQDVNVPVLIIFKSAGKPYLIPVEYAGHNLLGPFRCVGDIPPQLRGMVKKDRVLTSALAAGAALFFPTPGGRS